MEEEEITVALKRGREFYAKFNLDKNNLDEHENPKKISSGFWMTNEQLMELASDLVNSGCRGIGFMVGTHYAEEDGVTPIFSVEIVPWELKNKKDVFFKNIDKHTNILNENVEIHTGTDITQRPYKKIKGYLSSIVARRISHIKENIIEIDEDSHEMVKRSNEGQRFPPPEL